MVGKTPKKPQIPQFDPIEKPIQVFLSSKQDEFLQVREDLKRDIDEIKIRLARPFKTILVDMKRGPKWERDIDRGLSECDVFILLLGAEPSDITRDEFVRICRMGISVYVYIFLKPGALSPKSDKSPNHDFLEQEIKQRKIRIKGYAKPYRTYGRLFDDVSADLAYCVVEMVHESAAIRRVIGS